MSITLTPNLGTAAVGVQVDGFTVDGPVTVYRQHPDGSSYAVRGFDVVSGGSGFAWDYELPFATDVTYYADNSGVQMRSASVRLDLATMMVRVPGQPGNDAPFNLVGKPDVKYDRPTTVLKRLNGRTPIILSGPLSSASFSLTVELLSDAAVSALENAVASAPALLLLLPHLHESWQYVQVAGVSKSPVSPFLSLTDGDPGSWAQVVLDCTVVDQPVGDVYGDPHASYQAIVDNRATYQAVVNTFPTYLDVLKGV